MACVNRELMACHLCNCMLPTFITQLQYFKHIQVSLSTLLPMKASHKVKHNELSKADVRKAFLHLEKSNKLNPHLVPIAPSLQVGGSSFSKIYFYFLCCIRFHCTWVGCTGGCDRRSNGRSGRPRGARPADQGGKQWRRINLLAVTVPGNGMGRLRRG